jgi:hypothetical protein
MDYDKSNCGCGPSIYNADAATVAGSQQAELDTVKIISLIKKLGLADGANLNRYRCNNGEIRCSNKNKYRAVIFNGSSLQKKVFTINIFLL